MKINWGTGIFLAFLAFIAFILYFVVVATTSEKARHDLVTEYYYEEELDFQNEIDAIHNAMALDDKIVLKPSAEGLLLEFPATWDQNASDGRITGYRPSNKSLDFEIPIALEGNKMLIPSRRLPEGRWDISIRWHSNGMEFLQKERITFVARAAEPTESQEK